MEMLGQALLFGGQPDGGGISCEAGGGPLTKLNTPTMRNI